MRHPSLRNMLELIGKKADVESLHLMQLSHEHIQSLLLQRGGRDAEISRPNSGALSRARKRKERFFCGSPITATAVVVGTAPGGGENLPGTTSARTATEFSPRPPASIRSQSAVGPRGRRNRGQLGQQDDFRGCTTSSSAHQEDFQNNSNSLAPRSRSHSPHGAARASSTAEDWHADSVGGRHAGTGSLAYARSLLGDYPWSGSFDHDHSPGAGAPASYGGGAPASYGGGAPASYGDGAGGGAASYGTYGDVLQESQTAQCGGGTGYGGQQNAGGAPGAPHHQSARTWHQQGSGAASGQTRSPTNNRGREVLSPTPARGSSNLLQQAAEGANSSSSAGYNASQQEQVPVYNQQQPTYQNQQAYDQNEADFWNGSHDRSPTANQGSPEQPLYPDESPGDFFTQARDGMLERNFGDADWDAGGWGEGVAEQNWGGLQDGAAEQWDDGQQQWQGPPEDFYGGLGGQQDWFEGEEFLDAAPSLPTLLGFHPLGEQTSVQVTTPSKFFPQQSPPSKKTSWDETPQQEISWEQTPPKTTRAPVPPNPFSVPVPLPGSPVYQQMRRGLFAQNTTTKLSDKIAALIGMPTLLTNAPLSPQEVDYAAKPRTPDFPSILHGLQRNVELSHSPAPGAPPPAGPPADAAHGEGVHPVKPSEVQPSPVRNSEMLASSFETGFQLGAAGFQLDNSPNGSPEVIEGRTGARTGGAPAVAGSAGNYAPPSSKGSTNGHHVPAASSGLPSGLRPLHTLYLGGSNYGPTSGNNSLLFAGGEGAAVGSSLRTGVVMRGGGEEQGSRGRSGSHPRVKPRTASIEDPF